tara:strand:+ start:100 stop:561 length:462 start_codon:yes stop_codon:yes gene_type:complete
MIAKKQKTKGVPDVVDKHVGKRLKIRRSLLGLSQEKLAEAAGITFQQIQKYEHGTNRISAGRLFKFSEILQVPVGYFYEDLVGDKKTSRKVLYGLSDSEQEGFKSSDNTKLAETDLFNQKETLDLLRVYYSIEDKKLRKDLFKKIKVLVEASQ